MKNKKKLSFFIKFYYWLLIKRIFCVGNCYFSRQFRRKLKFYIISDYPSGESVSVNPFNNLLFEIHCLLHLKAPSFAIIRSYFLLFLLIVTFGWIFQNAFGMAVWSPYYPGGNASEKSTNSEQSDAWLGPRERAYGAAGEKTDCWHQEDG